MPLSRALRDHIILITLSVFRANQGSSFWEPFAYNSKYDCTLLLVPFLIMICSNFHLLSIYQSRENISLVWLTLYSTQLCVRHTCLFVEAILFWMPLFFVPPKAPFISAAVSSKVWEGLRCRLSQGWQLGAVLTCSLIKSSWARVHLWQGLCQAADRWEAVLNTNVTLSWDRQEKAPHCANNSCNSILNIWHKEGESWQRVYVYLFPLDMVCIKASCGLCQMKHSYSI